MTQEKRREIRIKVPAGVELSDAEAQAIIDELSGETIHTVSASSAAAVFEKEEAKSQDVAKAEVAKQKAVTNPVVKTVIQGP